MMLLEHAGPGGRRRTHRHDYLLGGTTAAVAGFVNVCSVIAFFAFSSNVTGHVAIFAEEVVKGHWHQLSVVLLWVLSFLFGAFAANLSITRLGGTRPVVGRLAPLFLELVLIATVAYYGQHHYAETLRETEVLVGLLVFCMGLQNGAVASVSGGVVKTTHVTGLFTDLGIELSLVLQRRRQVDPQLLFKFRLHLIILAGYVLGGVGGGALFLQFGFSALYVASAGLLAVLAHDLVVSRVSSPVFQERPAGSSEPWASERGIRGRPEPDASSVRAG